MSTNPWDTATQKENKMREEAIELLTNQIQIEQNAVNLYKKTEGEIQSKMVKQLLHMIQLDSLKHIDICQIVIDALKGEDVFLEEKQVVLDGLKAHVAVEKDSTATANKVLKNIWIRETEGLQALIKEWRDDEKKHHGLMKKLMDKRFYRKDFRDVVALYRSTPELMEERYQKIYKNIFFGRKKKHTQP